MATVAGKSAPKRRTASKEVRRQQLIKATIRAIAKRGLSDTTMADVAREAGLSQGIINLHFQSKDKLFLETLRFLADEYKSAWERTLEKAGPEAADRLAALVTLDFTPAVCERKKLAVWFAFWGEAKSRPTYLKLCAERDREYDRVLQELCRQICLEGRYADIDPRIVAHGLAAMSEGLWLDLLIGPDYLDRNGALRICFAYLAHIFPRHFSAADS